jgi:hypothetical protein
MIQFFAWLVLICVVPFVFAMLELQLKESKRQRKANRGGVARIGSPGLVINFTAVWRGHEFVRVTHTTGVTARWSDRCSLWTRTEGDAVLKEVLLHEIGLASAPIGGNMRRSVELKSYRWRNLDWVRRSGWTSFN